MQKYNVADQVYIINDGHICLCFISDYYKKDGVYKIGISEVEYPGEKFVVNPYKYKNGFQKVPADNIYKTFNEALEKLKRL